MEKIGVALYGGNGHQVHRRLADHPHAKLVGVCAFDPEQLPQCLRGAKVYRELRDVVEDAAVQLVSLCSPLRSEQAGHAIACLRGGKHVYAEKPCALTEAELDEIVAAAKATGLQFHEMAGTVVARPYAAMRAAVQAGEIGDVVQVLAQKCYPWKDRRPADEAVDGGLARQVGVYVTRFVEHIACQRITSLQMLETRHGNADPVAGSRMAVSFQMTLANGGIASGICNYLNPMSQRLWGYEILRVFGTRGILESNTDNDAARLIRSGEAPQPLAPDIPARDYFDLFVASLQQAATMPLAIEDELSPTRWIIRAKA
jgi:predicted dehydrogenase